jgi:hypothetical protein
MCFNPAIKKSTPKRGFFIQNKSDVKQEVHHIAIFNDVIFPFRTHLACFFRALLTLVGDEVFKRDSLRE